MEKNTRDLIIDFLTARIMQQRRYWEITSKKPDSVFLHSQFHLNQDFQKRRVRFQPEFQTLLFLRKNPNTFSSIEPDPFLVQAWSQTLNAPTSEATSLLNQFGNFMVTDHRRRYGPLSRPQVRFLKKAAEVLEEAIQRGAYPHWSRTFVVGPMIRKSIKFKNILTQFPEINTIEFRPLNPRDLGFYFELPLDEYRLRRIPSFQPSASLVIDYSWCEVPQNYFPTTSHKILYESIRAQEFNQLLMKLCPLLGDGDIMARLIDNILSSGGPTHTPDSITQDYCPLTKNQITDFLSLIDISDKLSKATEPSTAGDWILITNAIQTLTDARFTRIGMHSRFALAISCIEGLLCKAGEVIGKEDLAIKCGLVLSTIGFSPTIVKNNILKAYKVRSKFVHGHRSVAEKLASDHKLLQSIEGYGRRLIIITSHLSFNLRFGSFSKKYKKYKLPAIFDAANNPKNELYQILRVSTHPTGNNVRSLLRLF